jgi:hypothetical protein
VNISVKSSPQAAFKSSFTLRLWVTYLPASAMPLLTASILACAANGFGQLAPTGRGASGLRLHYRPIDVAVFDEFIDRPKDFSFHPEKLPIANALAPIVSPLWARKRPPSLPPVTNIFSFGSILACRYHE